MTYNVHTIHGHWMSMFSGFSNASRYYFNGSLETGDLLMPVSQTKKRGCRKVECVDQSTGFPTKEM